MNELVDAGDYYEETFKGLIWNDKRLSGASFEECEFIGHEAKRHVMPQTLKFHPGLDEL